MTEDQSALRDLRSYGRRRGRARSKRQDELWATVLPRVGLRTDLEPLSAVFAMRVSDVWLEIGFGSGEHLIRQADLHPQIGIIGCEPYEDGVVKVLAALGAKDRPNVRLWPNDARPLLRMLPPESIGRAFILFPDPWPKKRHSKRRLVAPQTIDDLARVLRSGAELRIATDAGTYATSILVAVMGNARFRWTAEGPSDWRERPDDWPPTRYETKAHGAGRRCYYFRFERP